MLTNSELRIIIIEDNIIFAEDLRYSLESHGFAVLPLCKDYESAVRCTQQHSPTLAFVDMDLNTKKNGLDYVKYMENTNKPIPIIFLSNYLEQKKNDALKLKYAHLYEQLPKGSSQSVARYLQEHLKHFVEKTHTRFCSYLSIFNTVNPSNYEIAYIKVEKPNVFITCRDKVTKEIREFSQRKSLKKVLSELKHHHLIQVHRSFVINPLLVEKVYGDRITLKGINNVKDILKSSIPIGDNYRKKIHNTFISSDKAILKYLFNES